MSNRVALDEWERALLAEYDLGSIQDVEMLGGGMFVKPLLLTTDRGKCVLRAHGFRDTEAKFCFQAETLVHAASRGIDCPQVIPTVRGEWGRARDGRYWALHEYSEGHQLDWDTWHSRKRQKPSELRHVGAHVALLHDALRDAQPSGDPTLSASAPIMTFTEIDAIQSQWSSALERLRSTRHGVAPLTRQAFLDNLDVFLSHWKWLVDMAERYDVVNLPTQVVHGDVSLVNLVFKEGGGVAFIDWDFTHLGVRLYDALGDVINRPPFSKGERASFREWEVTEYIRGYESATSHPLSQEEIRTIPMFSLARQFEDLRQRLALVETMASTSDHEYASMVSVRRATMDRIATLTSRGWDGLVRRGELPD